MEGAANPADQHSLSIVEFVSNLTGAVQYVHSIIDENTGNIQHLDGAVRIYNPYLINKRIGINLSKADKNTRYKKLWRLDYPIDVNTWENLIYYYYRDNETIAEYFGHTPKGYTLAIQSIPKFNKGKQQHKKIRGTN